MIELNYNDALRLLEKAVALKGADYVCVKVEGACANWHNGQPSCIVGHVYESVLGAVPEDDLVYAKTQYGSPGIAGQLGIDLTPEAEKLLEAVQVSQDCGTPWGEALEKAVEFTSNPDTALCPAYLCP